MTSVVLTGTKSEIAESIIRIEGDVREVIVFVAEPTALAPETDEDMFAEMEPFTVRADDVDDSREAIYTRMEGE